MTGAASAFIYTPWRCPRTAGTRSALAIRLTMGLRATLEMIALHTTLETFTFAGADYVDMFANSKKVNADLLAFLDFGIL